MALVRWDPFRELSALQGEVNRLFSRLGDGETSERRSFTPVVDVVETDNAIKLKAELAGMRPEDIKMDVQDNVLTISGERRFEEEVKEDKYYRIERRYGAFSRSIALPPDVDASKIEANYDNGVLDVTVPKTEQAKPKKIEIAVGGKKPETIEASSGTKATG
jgi:HSP20 family protein